jgi:hypothetical protein
LRLSRKRALERSTSASFASDTRRHRSERCCSCHNAARAHRYCRRAFSSGDSARSYG